MFSFLNKKVAVITAVFGEKGSLKEQPNILGADMFCFTDNKSIKSSQFAVRYVDPIYKEDKGCRYLKTRYSASNRNAKVYKILPHLFFPDYEYTIWIDSSIVVINKDFVQYSIDSLKDFDLALMKHPYRNCLYDEANLCIKMNLDDSNVIEEQVSEYKRQGYPENNGLFQCSYIVRRNRSSVVNSINEEWWNQIKTHSYRDQISIPYVLWKKKYFPCKIDKFIWVNDYFYVSDSNEAIAAGYK